MPFKKKCATEALHEQWGCPAGSALTRHVPVAVKKKLLELVGKTEEKNYQKAPPKFCQACIDHVVKEFNLDPRLPEAVPTDPDIESSPEEKDEPPAKKYKMDLSTTTPAERQAIAYNLGLSESKSLRAYALAESRRRDVDSIMSMDVSQGKSTLRTLEAFLAGLSQKGYDAKGTSSPKAESGAYTVYKTVESILNLTAPNLVLPAHFRESVLLYTLTGSKLALQVIGSGGPHASYQTVKSWLATLGDVPPEVQDGDLIVAFDNNQVLQRRWKVQLRNEVKCNIVTIVVFFRVDKKGKLQMKAELSPKGWTNQDLSQDMISRLKYLDQETDVKETHYFHLKHFLSEQIQKVFEEQVKRDGKFEDNIDSLVIKKKNAVLYKKCYNCNFAEIPKSKYTCPHCKVNITKGKMKSMGLDANGMPDESIVATPEEKEYRVFVKPSESGRGSHSLKYESQQQREDEYKDFHKLSREPTELPSIQVQQPVYVNPCSYEAVATTMRNIGQRCGIQKYGGNREWVMLVCDGIPYNLCSRIIKTMHVCSKCDLAIDGLEACAEHANESHQNEEVTFSQEFDWVILRPGSGHIEMNMVKGIVELGWDIFWKQMVIGLNFRSEAAQKSAKKVSDHHKGWTMCRIARQALTQELILPFVRDELSNNGGEPDLSVEKFMKYIMKAQDPNYTFMCDYVFELLDAIFLYRAGVRCGIDSFIHAGRAKFAKVWSGRIHPLYRELEIADTVKLMRIPRDLQGLVSQSDSLNVSGKLGTGEGVDFRLEEVNRQIQQWLPSVPSTKDWKIACCNYERLSTFRNTLFEAMEIRDPKVQQSKRSQNIDEEILAFRTELRAAEYLMSPNVVRTHVSLDGLPLSTNLKNMCKISRETRSNYVDAYLKHESAAKNFKAAPPAFKFEPVFITLQEEQQFCSVENQTIERVKQMVEEKIDTITDSDVRDALLTVWNETKKGRKTTKRTFIDFYYEIDVYIDLNEDESQDILSTPDTGDSM